MDLDDWLNNGWLVRHKASPQEIMDLLGVADRDLEADEMYELATQLRREVETWISPHISPKSYIFR